MANVYDGRSTSPVARIDSNGEIFGTQGTSPIGRIYANGDVYGTGTDKRGSVDANGDVYDGQSTSRIGWVDDPSSLIYRGGAAFLVLLARKR